MNESSEKNEKSKKNSLIKNFFWFLLNNVLNIAFPFVSGIYVARVMLPSSIGVVSAAQNFVQYFVILAFLGIPTYGMREIAKIKNNKEELNKLFSELSIINFLSSCFFTVVYYFIIILDSSYKEYLQLYLISGLLIAINSLNISWLYEGLEEFKFSSIRNLIFKVLSFCLLIFLVKNDDNYLIYASISIIGTAGNYILNWIVSRKFVRLSFKNICLKKHLKSIFYLVMVNLAIEIYTLVDISMLKLFSTNEHIAFYKYGSNISKILLQIINTLTMVLVPRISILYKEKRIDEYNHLLTLTFKSIILFSIPMIIGVHFVSEFLICSIYGDSYKSSAYVVNITSITVLLSPIGYLLGSRTLLVSDNERKMVIPVTLGAFINVLGNLTFIPLFQEYGAALSTVLSELVIMIVYLLLGKKHFRLEKWVVDVTKIIISAILMFCVLAFISHFIKNQLLRCILELVVAFFSYFISIFLLKEDMAMFILSKCKENFSERRHHGKE